MPSYDFVCPNCGYELVNVKRTLADINEKELCPKCHVEMEKVFDTMNFIKKGSGWTANSGKGRTK
jgi:putative FmdB family regulatory protein